MRFHCITLPLMRSILNVNVILADNMNIFSMLAKKKMDVKFRIMQYNHKEKTAFEWCTHFQSSGITEHNKIKTG